MSDEHSLQFHDNTVSYHAFELIDLSEQFFLTLCNDLVNAA